MIDLDIKFPSDYDSLPVTTQVSINLGENINALRDAILNIERILGLDVNIGLFTPDPRFATVAQRLSRIERGIAERNLVFREINVSDALSVLLTPGNRPQVKIGRGEANDVVPVNVLGSLTILAPQVANPETFMQTPLRLDVTTFNPDMSSKSLIRGKSNIDEPLLTIQDTNTALFISNNQTSYALRVRGNMVVEGRLTANFSVDHNKVLNIETVPTDATRGSTRHVTQGDYHSHRKGRYDATRGRWIVDSSTNISDFGIINHKDLEGIGTLPTHTNDFAPIPGVAYHVTGGDLHAHKNGDGAQIDHNDLKNINPKFTNHVTGGDSHDHTSGRGAQINHSSLANIGTTGADDIHVPKGGNHAHEVDADGIPLGDGAQISHTWLSNITTTGEGALHVTGGNAHAHTSAGDGGKIDHADLENAGLATHQEIDAKLSLVRAMATGTAKFTTSGTTYNQTTVTHNLGTDQFNVSWSLAGSAPPSNPFDVGVIYVSDKTATSFTLKRLFSASSVSRIYDTGSLVASTVPATLSHGLGSTPTSLDVMHEVAGKWEFLDPASFVTTDVNNIYTNFSALGSDAVRIIASLTNTSASLQPGPAVKAQLTTNFGSNSNLLFIARTPGIAGNNIKVRYEQNTSITTNPFIVASPTLIIVMYNTPVTANEVRLAVLNNATAGTIIDVINAPGNNGTGLVGAFPETALAGGADTSGISALDLEWIAVARA